MLCIQSEPSVSKSSQNLYLCVYIFICIYFYTVPLAWSFTHSMICSFYSYVCHTHCSIKGNRENIDLFFKAFLQCLSTISKCLPKKVVREPLLP